jgi:hypothetical protein
MARKAEADAKGPGEFFWFAMGLLPDDFGLVSIPVTLLIWVVFRADLVSRRSVSEFFRRIKAAFA